MRLITLVGLTASVIVATATTTPAGMITITTAEGNGADTYVKQGAFDNHETVNYGTANEVQAKHDGTYFNNDRKIYLRFDLASFQPGSVTDATLSMVITRQNDTKTDFTVFGLNDGFGETWSENLITWNNAPANQKNSANGVTADAVSLGRFSVFAVSAPTGTVINFTSNELMNFLNADTDGLATLIITPLDTNKGHHFASKEHSVYAPPTLTLNATPLNTTAVPEPSSLSLLAIGGMILLCWSLRMAPKNSFGAVQP